MVQGHALGYRKGRKGGRWVARIIANGNRAEKTLGDADDFVDANGQNVLSFAQAQEIARAWFAAPSRTASPEAGLPPFTVNIAIDQYLEVYKAGQTQGGGKAIAETVSAIEAFVRPSLGTRLGHPQR
jgi:hypothetical protein